jgi:hypothetical protein
MLAMAPFACAGIDESTLFTGGDGGSGSTDSGSKTDAGAKKDGSTFVDSGGPITGGGVQCTDGPCAIDSSQICCYSIATQSGTCGISATCSGDNQFPIPCDSTDDCTELGQPNTVCCAQADQAGNVTNVECKPASNCDAKQGQTNLCDPAASNPCPNGGTCTPSTVSLPGYTICVVQ